MAVNSTKQPDMYTERHIANMGFDPELQIPITGLVGFDGQGLSRNLSETVQIVGANDATYDYFAFSRPGTATASPKWMAFRVDTYGSLQYADGNASFDNVATDLTALSYSYS